VSGNNGKRRAVSSASQPKEMTMFAKSTKVLVAALVLAATSLTLVANASAAQSGWSRSDDSYMRDRHDPTNPTGF
jgi:hypothetical protein